MNVMSSKPRPKEGGVAAPHLFVVINREEGRKKKKKKKKGKDGAATDPLRRSLAFSKSLF
jgi:hypothetical protein